MADVTLLIAGRNYPITCGEGEEEHALSLAEVLNAKIAEATNGKPVTEIRGLLFGGLLLADSLNEAKANAKEAKKALSKAEKTAKTATEKLAETQSALQEAQQTVENLQPEQPNILGDVTHEAMISNAVKALDQLAERIEVLADRLGTDSLAADPSHTDENSQ